MTTNFYSKGASNAPKVCHSSNVKGNTVSSASHTIDPVVKVIEMRNDNLYINRRNDWWQKGVDEKEYRRYLQKRRADGCKSTRISVKKIKGIQPFFEVTLTDGSSRFVDGYFRDYYKGYIDTVCDPNVVRVSENKICNSINFNIEENE